MEYYAEQGLMRQRMGEEKLTALIEGSLATATRTGPNLGRVCRDVTRKVRGKLELEPIFASDLWLAERVGEQRQHQRGREIYSLHAPEVEYIGKGKAHRPYEFGVKVLLATTLHRSKGGEFIAHVKAMPGNPGACPRA